MHEWVSVEEASRRLGVSVSTVRRRIEAGELVGEREVIGGAKERYRVRFETQQPSDLTLQTEQPTRTTEDEPVTPQPLQATNQDASWMSRRSLEIIDAVIEANALTMDRQSERIDKYAELMRQEMERRVRAEADRDHLAAQLAAERAAREAAEHERDAERGKSWWRKLW